MLELNPNMSASAMVKTSDRYGYVSLKDVRSSNKFSDFPTPLFNSPLLTLPLSRIQLRGCCST